MNARIFRSTRSIRSRQARTASRAETSRLESFEISSEIVSSLSINSATFNSIAAQKVAKKSLQIKVIREWILRICFEFRSSNFGFRIPITTLGPYATSVRITGGEQARRILKVRKGLDVRPTPDLVKQAVFNSLGERVINARVLELFGGSGALSLESLSRGAANAVCVELSSKHARHIRDNMETTGVEAGRFQII